MLPTKWLVGWWYRHSVLDWDPLAVYLASYYYSLCTFWITQCMLGMCLKISYGWWASARQYFIILSVTPLMASSTSEHTCWQFQLNGLHIVSHLIPLNHWNKYNDHTWVTDLRLICTRHCFKQSEARYQLSLPVAHSLIGKINKFKKPQLLSITV